MKNVCLLIFLNVLLFSSVVATPETRESGNETPLAERLLKEAEVFTAEFDRRLEQKDWDDQVLTWDDVLNRVEAYIAGKHYVDTQTRAFFQHISRIASDVLVQKKEIQTKLDSLNQVLGALEKPGEREPVEVEAITEKRDFYNQELGKLRSRLTYLDITEAQAKSLASELSSLLRTELIGRLSQKFPSPFSSVVLDSASGQLKQAVSRLIRSPMEWINANKTYFRDRQVLYPALSIVLVAVLSGLFLRSVILRRWGRDRGMANPVYSRRVVAAVASGVARGVIPAFVLTGIWGWFHSVDIESGGTFGDLLDSFFLAALFFVVLSAFSHAFLSPGRPVWRLTSLSPTSSEYLAWGILLLLLLVSVDLFIQLTIVELSASTALFSVYGLLVVCLKGGGILWLMADRSWQSRKARLSGGLGGLIFRRTISCLAIVGIGASLLGYVEFGMYLVSRVILSGIALSVAFGLRGIIVEMMRGLTRLKPLRRTLGVRIISLQRTRVWSTVLLDIVMTVALLLVVLQIWDVPKEDIIRWLSSIADGFTVGNITISPADVVSAVLVFSVVMLLTQVLQRSLMAKVLPQVTRNRSLHHSISSAFRYLGLIIAVTLGFAALGTDFSNIALVAGALSVGVGFGLQNVVSNFVSGVILLFERPIKVGDWILVEDKEGIVQSINFRATELETFDKASVIIPNASLLSNSVTNLTLKDSYGRVDVKVGVAYGTQPQKVHELLMLCATNHPHVLEHPAPLVLFNDFGADSLTFELRCYIGEVKHKLSIASDLRYQIEQIFRDENIEIPFPQRVVRLVSDGTVSGTG
ncbi:MAG: mechanosensitive ion channel [Gammaproteobacteria bacterium]|nr:mechanosensitive ion channel [Gammaproteobacteria bacterium]